MNFPAMSSRWCYDVLGMAFAETGEFLPTPQTCAQNAFDLATAAQMKKLEPIQRTAGTLQKPASRGGNRFWPPIRRGKIKMVGTARCAVRTPQPASLPIFRPATATENFFRRQKLRQQSGIGFGGRVRSWPATSKPPARRRGIFSAALPASAKGGSPRRAGFARQSPAWPASARIKSRESKFSPSGLNNPPAPSTSKTSKSFLHRAEVRERLPAILPSAFPGARPAPARAARGNATD